MSIKLPVIGIINTMDDAKRAFASLRAYFQDVANAPASTSSSTTPKLAKVATTGDYNDLTNKPSFTEVIITDTEDDTVKYKLIVTNGVIGVEQR